MQLNPNQIMIDAINSGKLTHADANAIARGAGFTGDFGGGNVTNFFNSNQQAASQALAALGQRNLIPQQSLQGYMAGTVNNPNLPSGTTMVPQTMQVQQGEMQQPISITAPQISGVAPINTPQIDAQTASLDDLMVNYQTALDTISQGSGTYDAALIGNQTPQMEAAQGQVSELATIQGQLAKLYSDTEDGQVPLWARGAVRKAEDVLAARRLGASSIGAGAITAAIQQSAINIAANDAATYFQMDLTNLGNEQQSRLENFRAKQQSLLTDTAALNAAAQFNAASTAQVEMFQANLIASIKTQNANLTAQMRQFNTAEINKIEALNAGNEMQVDMFNNQQALAVKEFNAQMRFQAEAFNANMAQTIDASNVVWRRQVNTANTAAINASNQLNVQNAFNLSNYALNALWQQTRDEANWLWQSSEREADYFRNIGLVGSRRDAQAYLNNIQNDFTRLNEMYQSVGALAIDIIRR